VGAGAGTVYWSRITFAGGCNGLAWAKIRNFFQLQCSKPCALHEYAGTDQQGFQTLSATLVTRFENGEKGAEH
jgi:hypothetical protein